MTREASLVILIPIGVYVLGDFAKLIPLKKQAEVIECHQLTISKQIIFLIAKG